MTGERSSCAQLHLALGPYQLWRAEKEQLSQCSAGDDHGSHHEPSRLPCLYMPGCCSQQHHAGVGLSSKALAAAQKWPGELTATVKLPPKHSMGSYVFSMSCSTSNGHPNVSCIPYKWITHQAKVTSRYLLMPYYQKAFFGSLKKSPSEFAEVMAPASCRHAYTQSQIRPQRTFPLLWPIHSAGPSSVRTCSLPPKRQHC